MSEIENKLNVEDLEQVTGGVGRQEIRVKAITPRWVHPQRPDRKDL